MVTIDITNETIVVISGDQIIARIIEKSICKHVCYYPTFNHITRWQLTSTPYAVVVELNSKDEQYNLNILTQIKDLWPDTPIIVTSNYENKFLISNALAQGAHDFIYKPINPQELAERLLTRKRAIDNQDALKIFSVGNISVNTDSLYLDNGNKKCYLSLIEMKLLVTLLRARPNVVKRETLKKNCWHQTTVTDNALNRKLHEVRRILKELSEKIIIKTIYATGFTIEVISDHQVKNFKHNRCNNRML